MTTTTALHSTALSGNWEEANDEATQANSIWCDGLASKQQSKYPSKASDSTRVSVTYLCIINPTYFQKYLLSLIKQSKIHTINMAQHFLNQDITFVSELYFMAP